MRFPSTPAARALITTTVAYGVLEAGSRVLQALAIFLLAYWFRKDEFGEFYTYLAVYQLVTVFGTGGLMESLMGRVSRSVESGVSSGSPISQHARAYWRRSALTAVIFLAGSLLYAFCFGISLRLPVLIAALVSGSFNGFIVLIAANLTYAGQNRRSIALRSGYAILSYTLSLAMAAATHDILVYFWGQLIATAAVGALIAWRHRIALTAADAGAAPVGSDGSNWFLVPALLNWFFWYGLVMCVSSAFGTAQAADLAFANNIAQGLHIINLAVTQAWMSRYLQHVASSRQNTEARTIFVYRAQSVVMLFAAAGGIVAYELLKSLGVPLLVKYGDIGLPLAILLFAISASSNYFSAINAFAVNGEGRRLAQIALGAYACSVIILVPLAWRIGMPGIYIGLAVLIMSRGFASTFFAMRKLHAGFFDARLVAANAALFACCAFYYLH